MSLAVAKDAELNKLTNRALGLLARRDYSREELRERLSRQVPNEQVVDQVLDALEEQGLQSDARFCECFVRYRIDQGKGPLKIRQDLRQKGIPTELIEYHLNQDSEFWLTRAKQVYLRKFATRPIDDDKDFAKRLRFLVSRGFGAHDVYPILEKAKLNEFDLNGLDQETRTIL